MDAAQRIEGADGGDRERSGHERCSLVVRELHESPFVEQICPQVGQHQRPVRANRMADRMLHEGVRHQDEVRRQPTANRDAHRSEKVLRRAKPLLAPYERADEGAFEQERKHALHGERLADDTTGSTG